MGVRAFTMIKPEAQGCIYHVVNKKNGKGYVGQHCTLLAERRWAVHLQSTRAGSQLPFHRALARYGSDGSGFTWEVVWRGPVSQLNAKEAFFIKKLGTFINNGRGYNLTLGGQQGLPGLIRTTVHKQRASESLKAYYAAHPEAALESSLRFKGKPLAPAHRKKLSVAHKGKELPSALRAKLSVIHLNMKPFTPEHKANMALAAKRRYERREEREHTSKALLNAYVEDPTLKVRIWEGRRAKQAVKSGVGYGG
jgi:group I intron endonuclease